MRSNISFQVSEDADLRLFLMSAFATLVFMALFVVHCKIYDLSTAGFFALGLGYLVRGKLAAFHVLYPLACVNRETTFLLTLVFMAYYFRRMAFGRFWLAAGFQGAAFLAIRMWLMWLFRDNPGVDAMIRPLENLQLFMLQPFWTFVHWGIFAMLTWRCVRTWRRMPPFLRLCAAMLFPFLMAFYLVLGWAFEVRVFAEGYAVMVLAVSFQRLAVGKSRFDETLTKPRKYI
jgi:hypothetical protein